MYGRIKEDICSYFVEQLLALALYTVVSNTVLSHFDRRFFHLVSVHFERTDMFYLEVIASL